MTHKFYTSILLLLLFSFSSRAQNWKTVRLNDTTWFAKEQLFAGDFRTLRVCWVDSFQISGNDSIFYFYRSLRDSLSVGDCIDSLGPSWLGAHFIRLADGDELYFNGVNDTIWIKTMASPGATWTAYENANGLRFEALVVGSGVQLIDGVTDSVKTIALQAYQGSSQVANWHNTTQLIISKNHGWVKTFDMFSFMNNTTWSNISAIADSLTYERLASSIRDINVADENPFAKFQLGNEWIKKEHDYKYNSTPYNTYKFLTHDSVMAVQQLTSNAIQVTIKTKQSKWTYGPNSSGNTVNTSYVHTDTLYSDTSSYRVSDYVLPDYNWNLEYKDSHYGQNNRHFMKYMVDTVCGANRFVIDGKNMLPTFAGLFYNNGCMYASPGLSETRSYYWRYMEDFGNIILQETLHEANMTVRYTEYLYIKLGGCVLGEKTAVLDVEDVDGETANVQVYPIPAGTSLFVNGIRPGKQVTIQLTDITGRCVYGATRVISNVPIDISILPSGYYIAQITIEGRVQFQKVLIAK